MTSYQFRVWYTEYELFINSKMFKLDILALDKLNPEFIVQMKTSAFDRTGKPIYAGDIIRIHNANDAVKEEYWNPIFAIEFDGWSFTTKYLGGGLNHDCNFSIRHWFDRSEIIGNIFENPELIKN